MVLFQQVSRIGITRIECSIEQLIHLRVGYFTLVQTAKSPWLLYSALLSFKQLIHLSYFTLIWTANSPWLFYSPSNSFFTLVFWWRWLRVVARWLRLVAKLPGGEMTRYTHIQEYSGNSLGLTAEYPATLKLWSEWIRRYAVSKNLVIN